MKIVENRKECLLRTLALGAVFFYDHEYHIKSSGQEGNRVACTCLNDGVTMFMDIDEVVLPCPNAEFYPNGKE